MNMKKTSIRCAIHDWIEISPSERRVLDTAVVQRLRHVTQLTAVDMVYPGGTHNRFSHSLGTMHIAGKYATHLFQFIQNQTEREHYIQVARLAGLLHDCAHGCFSHSFDHSVYSQCLPVDLLKQLDGHDIQRIYLIYFNRELVDAIRLCGVDPAEIHCVWTSKANNSKTNPSSSTDWLLTAPLKYEKNNPYYSIIGSFLHGPLGADRIDFTLRDSYETGMMHLGTIAASRIISLSSIQENKLVYDIKCMNDIIQCLQARAHMYRCVYLHKTSMAASVLIERMLALATRGLNLIEKICDLNNGFIWLTDSYVVGSLLSYQGDEPDMLEAQKVAQNLTKRQLPKMIHETISTSVYDFSPLSKGITYSTDPQGRSIATYQSRVVHTLDPKQFEKHAIFIWNSKNQTAISFEQALAEMGIVDQKPTQIKRVFLIEY